MRHIRKKKKPVSVLRRLAQLMGVLLLAIIILLGISAVNFFNGLHSGLTTDQESELVVAAPGDRINILILGVDVPKAADGTIDYSIRSRTDTMMVATVDMEMNTLQFLSIPRDTRVQIPGRQGNYKINSAHVYGGPALAIKTVENLLEIPIHYYVRTNVEGFASIIDILGGVTVDVEKDMHYEDPWQGLYIDLKAGLQVLDGNKAMQYVRYRSDGDDLTRIRRQQKFLGAVADEFFEFSTLFKLPRLAGEVAKYLDTNMKPMGTFRFIPLLVKLNPTEMEMTMVPGTPSSSGGVSYWIPNMTKLRQIIDHQVWGIDRDVNSGIRVEVLNGSGKPGLATSVSKMLKSKGFDVVNVSTADRSDYETTSIYTYHYDAGKMKALSRVFSFGVVKTMTGQRSDVDITIIIGKDFPE
jgi:LCP family protein required for cell wall assembly